MSDLEPINIRSARQSQIREAGRAAGSTGRQSSNEPLVISGSKPVALNVSFDRHELRAILNLYGRKVAEGEWRDYAIDFTPSAAVFSIFRRTPERPLYRIVKDPKLAHKQGAYSVVAATGLVLKRGHELANIIAVLDKKLKLVSR
jgi:hypothetical protein